MEKGKYLVFEKNLNNDIKDIISLTLTDITDKCYKVMQHNDRVNSYHSYWILKEDFEKKFEIVEKIEEPKKNEPTSRFKKCW